MLNVVVRPLAWFPLSSSHHTDMRKPRARPLPRHRLIPHHGSLFSHTGTTRTARLARLRADDRVADLASAVDAAVHVDDVVEADDLVEHDAQLTVVDEPQQVRHVVGALP